MLRRHAFALADELACVLIEDADASPQSLRRRIITRPIACALSYYVALHELGHAATWTLETMRPVGLAERDPRAMAARELLGEARAWAWALDAALVEPDQRTELWILDAWTSYVAAHGGNIAAGGVELVAAEHRPEYSVAWARCRRAWTWLP